MAILAISAAALGMELVLVRSLSIGLWHHFSYLVISTALLGFAAGGTFITLGQRAFRRNWRLFTWLFAVAFAITAPLVFWLSQRVPLDELQLLWDWRQVVYLVGFYLLYFIPFFCAGTCVVLALTVWAREAGRMYFFNLLGSGLGAAAFVALMYRWPPEELLLAISALAFLGAILLCLRASWIRGLITIALAAATLHVFTQVLPLRIELSQFKPLVKYSNFPDAKILARRHSPLARLDVLKAPAIRYLPGPSLALKATIPEQLMIISDGHGISAVNRFSRLEDLACYDYLASALPFHMTKRPEVCIIGAGGGSDVCQALALGASSVTAVELNPQVVELMTGELADFSGGIYNRSDVEVVVADGRGFLEQTPRRFDIIQISLLDSLSSAAAGVHALNESHLYTTEAIGRAMDRLKPQGLLCITRWLKVPARDALKMLATAAEAVRRRDLIEPDKHIAMIRGMVTATVIVSNQPLTQEQTATVRRFCRERWFDLIWLPDIRPDEPNRYNALASPVYYDAAREILGPRYEDFYRDYAYNIRPATDDKPYFFDFFRWQALPHLIRTMRNAGQPWLPLAEWGYLVLIATLIQSAVASAILILVPLKFLKRREAATRGRLATLIYFSMLGLAYIFLEMGFIQKLTLIIGDPVTAIAVTLAGFLVFSGLGSLCAGRIFRRRPRVTISLAVAAIVVVGICELIALRLEFDSLMSLARGERILLSLAFIFPLAFFMGMPFPTALRQLDSGSRPLVPWAWGVNGFASVTG
ncbi:MAG: SAM-dependent methyltransferase, partial [Phycisphaerae bacterium]|nr:SAM-dependent methyltransferase [Phycisphaerae bacterium]